MKPLDRTVEVEHSDNFDDALKIFGLSALISAVTLEPGIFKLGASISAIKYVLTLIARTRR